MLCQSAPYLTSTTLATASAVDPPDAESDRMKPSRILPLHGLSTIRPKGSILNDGWSVARPGLWPLRDLGFESYGSQL